jgi:diguanylate cyclase (GGDEF)-like protein
MVIEHLLQHMGRPMPKTSTMMRAWRTDSVEGPEAAAGPGAKMQPDCEARPAGSSGLPSWKAGVDGFRRFGAAVARAGHSAWSRSLGRSAARFEEALHGFTTELAASGDPEAIEAALVRLAQRIAPADRVELIRATGECPLCDVGPHAGANAAGAVGEEADVKEFRVRCSTADHGVLRLHLPEARARRADRPETRRRLAMACTLAACALESARLRSEWAWGCCEANDGRPSEDHAGDVESEMRTPHRPCDVVRDATFLNAVLPFALEQSRRHGEPVSLVCVKLDRLGAIRDLLGTSLADQLVQELGELVGSLVRASDLVARLDDDRIVALLVRARGDGAMKVARSIGRAVAASGLGSPRLPGTSVSIGAAEFPAAAVDAASLLKAADEAMAIARAGGSHSPVLAEPRPAPGHARIHVHRPATARSTEPSACGR